MILVFELGTAILLLLEFLYYKTLITPFMIIGSVYFLCIPLINLLSLRVNIYPVSNFNMFCTLIFLLLIWAANILFKAYFCQKKFTNVEGIKRIKNKIVSYKMIFVLLFIIGVLAYSFNLIQVIARYGINDTKNHAYGMAAHMGYMSLMLAPYITFYAIHMKKKLYYSGIIMLLMVLLLFQNKLPAIVLIIQCTIFNLMLSEDILAKDVLKKGVLILLAAFFIFIIVYSLKPVLLDRSMDFGTAIQYSFERFTHYLFSGFVSSNEYYRMPSGNQYMSGTKVIFLPFITLYEELFGNKNFVDPVIQDWILIGNNSGTNVGGLLSESVYQVGYFGAAIYIFLIGFMVCFFFNLSRRYQIYVNTSAYLITLIGLGFFCNFFVLFSTLEKLVYVIFFDTIILLKFPLKRRVHMLYRKLI